jgi:hypothetical protein
MNKKRKYYVLLEITYQVSNLPRNYIERNDANVKYYKEKLNEAKHDNFHLSSDPFIKSLEKSLESAIERGSTISSFLNNSTILISEHLEPCSELIDQIMDHAGTNVIKQAHEQISQGYGDIDVQFVKILNIIPLEIIEEIEKVVEVDE